MSRNARGRRPNQLNQLSQFFVNKSGKKINAEKFADDRSGSLALKIVKSKCCDVLPFEINESISMALSQRNTKNKIKAITQIISACDGLWKEIGRSYKARSGFQNRLLTDLKLKYIGPEDTKEIIIGELFHSLFKQLAKKQVRTAIRNDESTIEFEENSRNVNEQRNSKMELESLTAVPISPSQELNASEPDYSFEFLQDDMDPLSLLDLTEDSDLVEEQN